MCIRRRRSDTTTTVFRGARAAVVSTPLVPGGPRPPRSRPIAASGRYPSPPSPRFRGSRFFFFFAPSRRGRRSRGCSRRARSSGLCSPDCCRPLFAHTKTRTHVPHEYTYRVYSASFRVSAAPEYTSFATPRGPRSAFFDLCSELFFFFLFVLILEYFNIRVTAPRIVCTFSTRRCLKKKKIKKKL